MRERAKEKAKTQLQEMKQVAAELEERKLQNKRDVAAHKKDEEKLQERLDETID